MAAQKATNATYPLSFTFRNFTVTPEAFVALEGVWRQRATQTDITTPFNMLPFPEDQGWHKQEYKFSARQSRIGAFAELRTSKAVVSGLHEADLLSDGGTSTEYTPRLRQAWAKVQSCCGFAITGGQMWSLVTETGKSTDVHTERLPKTIDPQYVVGYSWLRQPGIRVQQVIGNLNGKYLTLAASLERSQINNVTANSANPSAIPENYLFYDSVARIPSSGTIQSVSGNTGVPDFLLKGTIDSRRNHIELGRVIRSIRSRYYPILSSSVTPTGSVLYTFSPSTQKANEVAISVFGSVRRTMNQKLEVAIQAMGGKAAGRYGTSQLADATVYSDGTLRPLVNYHGLFSAEYRPRKAFEISAYYGGEYAQRTFSVTASGDQIGYGPPDLNNAGCGKLQTPTSQPTPKCTSSTRYVQEAVLGVGYSLPIKQEFGRLQYQITYSFLQRGLWAGISAADNKGGLQTQENMVHMGLRYYIP